jgi:hypothetical protein
MEAQIPFGEFLDKSELQQLTGAARSKAQAAWLGAQGLPHRLVGGRLIVSRFQVRQWLEGAAPTRLVEPDLSQVR